MSIIYQSECGGDFLNKKNNYRKKKELKNKLFTIFHDKIKEFSTELQGILIDDMITAFENRLKVLKKTHLPSNL